MICKPEVSEISGFLFQIFPIIYQTIIIIQMGNSYIQGSRLRNIRTRKRIAKTDYEKYLRECSDRHSELEKQKWNLPLVPLEKPYQKGYVRFFVVRDDVKRSGLGEFFENLLTKINTYQYADNRKFQKKKKRKGRRIYVPRKQELLSFRQREWEYAIEKGKLVEEERKYFLKVERYNPDCKEFETYYEFAEPWRFILRVRPNIITHYRPIDFEIENELAGLNKVLDDYKNWGIIQKKVYRGGYSWNRFQKRWVPKAKYKRPLIKEMAEFRTNASALEMTEILLDSKFY